MTSVNSIVAFTPNKYGADLDSLNTVKLPCPRTGTVAMYLTDRSNTKIFELQKVSGCGRKASWMIDHSLYKDGSLYLVSPVDPLYISLPILERARNKTSDSQGRFRVLDEIFSAEHVGEGCQVEIFKRLEGFSTQVMHLCDEQKVTEDIRMYRLSDDKVLSWLQKKTDSLLSKFEQIPALANSASEICSGTESESEKVDIRRREAVYLLSKYLSKSWFSKLLESYGLEEINAEQNMGDITNYFTESPDAFMKTATKASSADTGTPAKKARKAEVPRSLAKVNTKGMKSLTTFFQKK
ncbi:hypothetical protein VTP01DRAFT_1540 [Rhizomucor pusillus]|uniref:uncharacterized protein n=1 Tax=Rhizomucor pusillus TaxID=4840 RepID=UPI00374484A0